jgi:hypothetical protein
MSKRSRVNSTRDAGFVLLEVLAALTISLFLFAVLSEAFSAVWSQARRPEESTWSLALARSIATGIRNGADLDGGDIGNFHYETDVEPLTIEPLDSDLPPAPAALTDTAETAAKPIPGVLQLVVVSVTSPSGHIYRYETIKLDMSGT